MARLFKATCRAVTVADLAPLDLFEGLDEAELESLAGRCVEMEIPSQQIVFEEGERADAFFVVSSGALAAYRDAPGQPVQLLARLHRHDFFGELGLVGGRGLYGASVRAVETSLVLRVERRPFLELLEAHPPLQLKLQTVAARRYSQSMSSVLDLGRRREVRIHFRRPVLVELEDGRRDSLSLRNLSLGGLCFDDAPASWRPGTTARFALILREGFLPLSGTVRWRRGDAVGIGFESRSADQDMLLQMAIRLMLESSP